MPFQKLGGSCEYLYSHPYLCPLQFRHAELFKKCITIFIFPTLERSHIAAEMIALRVNANVADQQFLLFFPRFLVSFFSLSAEDLVFPRDSHVFP
jgi:hypothetical protein